MENPSFLNEERMPMSPVTPEIMNQAREIAQEMLKKDEELREVDFGHGDGKGKGKGNSYVVSLRPDDVLGAQEIEVEGRKIYVGFAQKK